MEQKILKLILFQLKIIAVGCFVLIAFVLTSAFSPENTMDDFWRQLGISKEEGEERITESFLRGYLFTNGTANFKNVMTGDRVAITKNVLDYCKQHVNSEEFRKEYQEYRKKIRPIAPAILTKDQVRKELQSNYEEAIRNLQNDLNMALTMRNAEMKKSVEKSLAQCRKILGEVNAGNSKLITEQLIYVDMRYKSESETYQIRICDWEKNYPPDCSQLVKRRLTRFLDITKNIDFNASLKEANGKKIFVDPMYERKPAEWKMGYRAGREVVQTARNFAGQWMKELQ